MPHLATTPPDQPTLYRPPSRTPDQPTLYRPPSRTSAALPTSLPYTTPPEAAWPPTRTSAPPKRPTLDRDLHPGNPPLPRRLPYTCPRAGSTPSPSSLPYTPQPSARHKGRPAPIFPAGLPQRSSRQTAGTSARRTGPRASPPPNRPTLYRIPARKRPSRTPAPQHSNTPHPESSL